MRSPRMLRMISDVPPSMVLARERSNATCGLRSDGEPSSYTNSMAAAIALENRNQDLANKTDEVRDYMQAYAAPRRRDAGG